MAKTKPKETKDTLVSFRVSDTLLVRLKKEAESEQRTLADTVRRLVVRALYGEVTR